MAAKGCLQKDVTEAEDVTTNSGVNQFLLTPFTGEQPTELVIWSERER